MQRLIPHPSRTRGCRCAWIYFRATFSPDDGVFPLSQRQPTRRRLARYEIETDDLAVTYQRVFERLGTTQMIGCEAFDMTRLHAPSFAPIGRRIVAAAEGRVTDT